MVLERVQPLSGEVWKPEEEENGCRDMSLDSGQLPLLSLLNYRCVPWCSRSFQILHAAVICDILVQKQIRIHEQMCFCLFFCFFKGQQTNSAAVKVCFVFL